MLVVLNPLNAEEFAKRGWSKTDVRRYLWEHARRADRARCGPAAWCTSSSGRWSATPAATRSATTSTIRPPASRSPREPDDIHIVVAGGRSYFAAVLPGWGGFGGFAVTRPIRRA